MAAPRILLTTEELRREAADLKKAANDNKEVIRICDEVVNGLLGFWEGNAQSAFKESWLTKKTAFTRMTDEMERLADQITKFSNNMENQESTQTSNARRLANC